MSVMTPTLSAAAGRASANMAAKARANTFI
jgi:hypothetical protein